MFLIWNFNFLIQQLKLLYLQFVWAIVRHFKVFNGIFIMVQRLQRQILPNGLYLIKQMPIKIFGFSVTILNVFWSFVWLIISGTTTSNFTAANQLFLSNPQVDLWRFEVVYSFISETSSSALNFVINQPPCNGSCSITPLNGTTTDPFSISCPNWVDQDGIQDYSLYSMWRFFLNK